MASLSISVSSQKRPPPCEEGAPRRRVRHKIAVACERCRVRKRRCDGAKPKCGACAKLKGAEALGQVCQYIQHHAGGESSGMLQREQISPPTTARTSITAKTTAYIATSSAIEAAPSRVLRRGAGMPDVRTTFTRDERDPACSTPILSIDEYEIAVSGQNCLDAMGTVSSDDSRTFETNPNIAFFGPSSLVDLMSKIRTTLDTSEIMRSTSFISARTGSGDPFTSESPRGTQLTDSRVALKPCFEDFPDILIPPRREADRLVDSYFRNVQVLRPYLHEPTFREQYKGIWAADSSERTISEMSSREYVLEVVKRRIFSITLNLVFALGCRADPSRIPKERLSRSEAFYLRTQHWSTYKISHFGSLELVQAMLLAGHYLQTTERAAECWNIVGLTVRIAQGIGLHLEPPCASAARFTQLQLEMRRRVWAACMGLDR